MNAPTNAASDSARSSVVSDAAGALSVFAEPLYALAAGLPSGPSAADASATTPAAKTVEDAVESNESALSTSSASERFAGLVEQIRTRPQVALGVAAAAGIIVSTLVFSKVGRLMLLAAGGYVADRFYGSRLKRTAARLTSKATSSVTKKVTRMARSVPQKVARLT